MVSRIIITAAIAVYGLTAIGAPNARKFTELYAKYEECYEKDDYRGSVKYLEEAMPYIHPDSIYCFSNAYNGLSYAYWDLGQYDKAVDYGKRALECDRQIGDSTRISRSFNLLAILFTKQRRFDEAEHYIQEAIAYVPHSDTQMKAGRYAVFGEILSANGKNAEAISYIQQAYALDSIDNRTDKIPVRLSQLGAAYLRQKNYTKAETILAQATNGLRAINNDYSLCLNLISQTKNYMALGRNADAEKAANECLDICTQLNIRKTKLDALRLLADLRRSPDLYKEALVLNDSLYNEQISQQIADFEVRYATAEKEKENAQLQMIINRQHYVLVVLVIVFIALLGITMFVHIVRRMRRDIEHTEKLARELFVSPKKNHVSANKATTNAETVEIETANHPQKAKKSHTIVEPIAQQADDNQAIISSETTTSKQEDNIQLSPREVEIIKACCQGKMSKEIAEFLAISKKTVDNHKSTIYQKIGVCNNTELILFAVKHRIATL